MKRILFISSGSIGDAVISTGILGWLMDNHPDAEFIIATGVASAPLFLPCPRVVKIIPIKKQTFNRHWLHLWNETRHTHWDVIVDLRGSLLSYLLPCKQRFVFHSPDKSLPKAEQLARLLGISPAPPTRLWVGAEARKQVAALLPAQPYYVIAPKTNSTAKDWPIERFSALVKQLHVRNPDRSFVVLATHEQKPMLGPLLEALPSGLIHDLSGQTDLQGAIAVLEKAKCFIGNDSGLLHMSAALGIPSVGIYGPSNDKTYAPRGPHVSIITSHDFKPGEEEKRDNAYMLKIPVETVYNAVNTLA